MGYSAAGNGIIILKNNDINSITPEMEELLRNAFSDSEVSPDHGLWLTYKYDKYDEDTVMLCLEAIALVTESGSVEFTGEDDSFWRFVFQNGKWIEQSGEIVYGRGDYRTFNIAYSNSKGVHSETEFDIKNQDALPMMVELIGLFNTFCAENNEGICSIDAIREVPYDGDDA